MRCILSDKALLKDFKEIGLEIELLTKKMADHAADHFLQHDEAMRDMQNLQAWCAIWNYLDGYVQASWEDKRSSRRERKTRTTRGGRKGNLTLTPNTRAVLKAIMTERRKDYVRQLGDWADSGKTFTAEEIVKIYAIAEAFDEILAQL